MAAEMTILEKEDSPAVSETVLSEVFEEEDPSFQDINTLLEHGVSKDEIAKLQKVGINTVKGVLMSLRKRLLVAGLDQARLDYIVELCGRLSFSTSFLTAAQVSDQRRQIFRITTGSKQLDKLLGGGVEAMSITEAFGEFRTGKTQLAHTLCVTAQMTGTNGYTGGKVIFIDTEHTFRPDRLKAIAERFNLDQATVLENVLCARAYTSDHQYELLKAVATKLHEEAGIFKLLIIDSIMALFRVDYSGVGEMAERQAKLAQMLSKVKKISEEYNVAVFVTNQITSDFSVPQLLGQTISKPVGGNIMAHASTIRVCLKKGDGPLRRAEIVDSPDLEESEAEFIITVGGVDDPSE